MAIAQMSPRPPQLRAGALTSERLVAGFLGLVALALAFLIAHDVFLPPPAQLNAVRTAAVSTGTVRAAVTGTGTLVPAAQQNLGFRTPGQLTEVDAKVGDHVAAGQVLARVDPTTAELALQQAEASLAAAQANLANTLNGTTLVQSQHTLAQARQSYTDTVNQVNLTNSNDQAQLNADQAQTSADQAGYWYTQYQPTLQTLQGQLNAAQAQYRSDGCNAYTVYVIGPCASDQSSIQSAQSGINCIQGVGAGVCSPQQMQIAAAFKSVSADTSRTAADNSKLAADNAKYSADQQAGQRSTTQAQYSVTNAQDAYNSQASNRSGTIDQQRAAVAGAQAAVGTAQQNLDATTLTAPMAGVITGVTGQVGDYVAASSPSSGGQAPGSTAPLPAATTTSGSSSGGTAFMVLMNDKAFQAVVTLAESDATKVQALQSGSISFDALPNLTIPAHVLAVAPAATISSNVVNYYVTLTLDSLDNRLKSGLTANASLTTANASNVIVVPNSAITRLGGAAFVSLLRGKTEVRTRIQTGIVGDTSTEVTQGVQVGDRVVLPQLRVATGTTTRGGAGGGGGGIRLGGGTGGG